jgi:uncharacterized small protein (DUF1192 family)
MYWKYNIIDGLDPEDTSKVIQVLAESQRTFSVSENEKRIAFLQEEIDKLQAENDATENKESLLTKSVIQLKEELK